MKIIVLKLDLQDGKAKQKALKAVSSLPGIDTIAVDTKERRLTVVGSMDPVDIVSKLRKLCHTEILTVGPLEKKEEPKKEKGVEGEKKEEPKKEEEAKKEELEKKKNKKEINPYEQVYYNEMVKAYRAHMNAHMNAHYYVQSAEENPNSCAIM